MADSFSLPDLSSLHLRPIHLEEDLEESDPLDLIHEENLHNPLDVLKNLAVTFNALVQIASRPNFTLHISKNRGGEMKVNLELTPSAKRDQKDIPALPKRLTQLDPQNQWILKIRGQLDPNETYFEVSGSYYFGKPFYPGSYAHLTAWHSILAKEEQSLGILQQLYLETAGWKLALGTEFSFWQQFPEQVITGGVNLHLDNGPFRLEGGGNCRLAGHLSIGSLENSCSGDLNLTVVPESKIF
jgi:hypothetical protein